MENVKTSLSNAASFEELGDYWDEHGLDEVWNQTHEVSLSVEVSPQQTLILAEPLQHQLYIVAARQGTTAQELLNQWLQERLEREVA